MQIKNYIIIFILAIFCASCQKDYQCQCTNGNNTYDAGDPVTAYSKGDADNYCGQMSSSQTTCKAK